MSARWSDRYREEREQALRIADEVNETLGVTKSSWTIEFARRLRAEWEKEPVAEVVECKTAFQGYSVRWNGTPAIGMKLYAAPVAKEPETCSGYSKCDGDLVGEPHSPECPVAKEPAAPIQAHSKSEYKRMTTQGADVAAPVSATPAAQEEKDAARYRWMTTNAKGVSDWPDSAYASREAFEAAIDAAMLAVARGAAK